MNLEEFKNNLISGLEKNNINISLSEEKLNLLFQYMKFILEKNKHINLTAIKDEKEFIYKHYIDSLYLTKYISAGDIIDIGTGGGFPGIPLLIIVEGANVVFLDSKNKKIKIIEEFVQKKELAGATFVHARAEDTKTLKELVGKFDYVVTRAVSNIANVIDYSIPFLKQKGIGLAMRGSITLEEKNNLQRNLNVSKFIEYEIKDNNETVNKRSVLFLQKNTKKL